MSLTEEQIKNAVRQRYSRLAVLNESCCGAEAESSCGSSNPTLDASLPSEALSVIASCGNPLIHVQVREGETVLDLGSGGGIDVFRASKLVGEKGRVIGLDATAEMIFRARETSKKYGYKNVEFRLGEIEHMPIESNSVDLVISNCVLNLVPDKELAFREIHRVLKPGGRISVSDMVATQEGLKVIKPEDWAACIAGAVTFEEYRNILEKTGFVDIEGSDESHPINQEMASKGLRVKSVTWKATKPS
ncbi:MAG: methyltransferase domain-containing protein [Candidatus Bathyarchaeia archaeon]|jgi:SAM-dependent methyltransferase